MGAIHISDWHEQARAYWEEDLDEEGRIYNEKKSTEMFSKLRESLREAISSTADCEIGEAVAGLPIEGISSPLNHPHR